VRTGSGVTGVRWPVRAGTMSIMASQTGDLPAWTLLPAIAYAVPQVAL
jgi:hypothetical protein